MSAPRSRGSAPHSSAPIERAVATSVTAKPPAITGGPPSIRRAAAMSLAAAARWLLSTTVTMTARRSSCAATTLASEAGGVSAPRLRTSYPERDRMSASIAAPSMCRSPVGRATRTVPRRRPRRWNLDPMRPTMDSATLVARCSWSIRSSPRCHASPMPCMAGPRIRRRRPQVRRPRPSPPRRPASCRRRRRRASGRAGDRPRRPCAQSVRLVRALPRRLGPPAGGCPSGAGEVDRIDPPLPADLAGGKHPEPDAPIDRHVVDAEAIGGLVERQELGRLRGHQSVTTLASCHGLPVVTGRNSTEPGNRAPSLIRVCPAGQFAGGRSTWSITWMTPLRP